MANIVFVYNDYEHLGTANLLTVVKKHGHQAVYVHYKYEDAFIGDYARVDYENIADRVAESHPDLVCFSCVTSNFQSQINAARACKKRIPEAITLFGGIHPTIVPERVLKYPEVDGLVMGEGELVFPAFLEMCQHNGWFGLPDQKPPDGVTFKKNGVVKGHFTMAPMIRNLDALPFPDKTPFYEAMPYSQNEYWIMASRGCQFKCSYCYAATRDSPVIKRSPENVIAELQHAIATYHPKSVFFLDDIFTGNRKWLYHCLELYKKKIRLPFSCSSYPSSMDLEKAEALKQAGCVYVNLGVQSISETTCKEILNRPTRVHHIRRAIAALNTTRLLSQVDHMLGIPNDPLDVQEEAMKFYNEVRPTMIQVFHLVYFPRSPITHYALKEGFLTPEEVDRIEEGLGNNNTIAVGKGMRSDHIAGVSLVLNWLPVLPRPVVNFLVWSKLYRYLRIRNLYIAVAIPRLLLSLFHPNYSRGRQYIRRYFQSFFTKDHGQT